MTLAAFRARRVEKSGERWGGELRASVEGSEGEGAFFLRAKSAIVRFGPRQEGTRGRCCYWFSLQLWEVGEAVCGEEKDQGEEQRASRHNPSTRINEYSKCSNLVVCSSRGLVIEDPSGASP